LSDFLKVSPDKGNIIVISMKAKKNTIRAYAAKTLSDPRFQMKIAKTDKKVKDPKISRREWKNKGEY